MGVIYQSRTGNNVFFTWSAMLLGPLATVAKPPIGDTKPIISGPAQHGLALASMLTIALPFAVLPLLQARRRSERLKYLVAIGLILGADLSTNERTAVFAPIAAIIVLAAYKREILRWAPLAHHRPDSRHPFRRSRGVGKHQLDRSDFGQRRLHGRTGR